MPDDLRTLIDRVAAIDGSPLAVDEDGAVAWREERESAYLYIDRLSRYDADAVAGVLWRDLERVAQTVKHEVWPEAMAHQRHIVVATRGDTHTTGLAATPLRAHLDCWLDAHAAGLVGRQEATMPKPDEPITITIPYAELDLLCKIAAAVRVANENENRRMRAVARVRDALEAAEAADGA